MITERAMMNTNGGAIGSNVFTVEFSFTVFYSIFLLLLLFSVFLFRYYFQVFLQYYLHFISE